MRRAFSVLLVLLLAAPALSRELMTRKTAQVREKPDKRSKVLAEIAPNVKIDSDKRQDFWFHVSAQIDGRTVSGWVNQADVTTMMGRSKGQLLAENRRLYDELADLRKRAKVAQNRLKAVAEEKTKLWDELEKATAALDQAKKETERLRAALRDELEKFKARLAAAKKEIKWLKTALEKARNGRE